MSIFHSSSTQFKRFRGREAGGMTIFTGVMILMLMTLFIFYASRVGILEQRVSANDMRQKIAFHAAEAGISHAKEYFVGINRFVVSEKADLNSNGDDGWMLAGSERWLKCSEYTADFDTETSATEVAHPCRGESSTTRRANSFFYYWDDPDDANDDPYELKLDTESFLSASERVNVRAVLCVLELDFDPTTNGGVPFSGCNDTAGTLNGEQFMVTFLSRGETDCIGAECKAEALIAVPISNFSSLNGPPPSVPLSTKTTFPPGGTAEIVTNPNGGGVGVPLSVWASNNSTCPTDPTEALSSGVAWTTCERHEYFGVDYLPDDLECPTANCSCSRSEAISYTDPSDPDPTLGQDMFWDSDFPCSLFEYYFGIPTSQYQVIKQSAQIVSDCDAFDIDSNGLYWVSGSTCNFGGKQVGTPDHPVIIISAATTTWLNGNTEVWGVLFITDAEDADAELNSAGSNVFYGAIIVDVEINKWSGNLKLVYAESIIERARDGGGSVGELMGGWTDFPKDWR